MEMVELFYRKANKFPFQISPVTYREFFRANPKR